MWMVNLIVRSYIASIRTKSTV
uniref:Uncharacterized protein n=1 Tax=Romanomermis culicivorax TaxID=13658 RepID=A0A915KCT8_ROMCU